MHSEKLIQPFKHNCNKCQWLGWACGFQETDNNPHGLANLYLCDRDTKRPALIMRFSDEPSDYVCHRLGHSQFGPIGIQGV